MMITWICVNTGNVTISTTLNFKIMSPKILNSQCILIHSCPIHCVPNEHKRKYQTFFDWTWKQQQQKIAVALSNKQQFEWELNKPTEFCCFLTNREFDTEVHGFCMCHPYSLTFCVNQKWSLSYIWPQAVSIHWVPYHHGKPFYTLFLNTSPINLKVPYLMPDIANATVPNLTYFIKENKSG